MFYSHGNRQGSALPALLPAYVVFWEVLIFPPSFFFAAAAVAAAAAHSQYTVVISDYLLPDWP